MSIETIPYILKRKCKDRTGIRITDEYLGSFWNHTPRPAPDSEEAYNQLVNDFLSKSLDRTSEPVIPTGFGQSERDTFPPGQLRHGGGVVLQIQDTVDIRQSSLSQLNSITNNGPVRQVYALKNQDEITLSRGMLRWTLTDGKHQIQAMEIETIPELSLMTPFGCKESVKVLGGQVPELFGGDMVKETIHRLEERVGIESTTTTPITTTTTTATTTTTTIQQPLPVSRNERIPEDDLFDDDFDYAQLENMELDRVEQQQQQQQDTLMDEIPSDSSLFDEDLNIVPPTDVLKKIPSDSDSDVFEDATDTIHRQAQPSISSTRTVISSLSKKARSAPSSSESQPRKKIDLKRQSDTFKSSITLADTVDLTVGDYAQSTQAEIEDVSWIDSSVWDDLSEATKEKESNDDGTYVDSQGKTHITFIKLQQTLKAMENDDYRSDIPESVIVRVKCVQFGKLVTSNRLYSLVLYFDDPDQPTGNPIQVIFSNDKTRRG
ncbi:hypothetical protein G6F56_005402 [Rhizopus delemar]|nr:hypothetical protein G6F56_005402 [Rhizopus delemar]